MGADGVHAFSDDDGAEFLDELVEEGPEYFLKLLTAAAETDCAREVDYSLGPKGMAAAELTAIALGAAGTDRQARIATEILVFERDAVRDLLPTIRSLPDVDKMAEAAVRRVRAEPSHLAKMWFMREETKVEWLAYTDDLLARIAKGAPT
ncbi:MAG: DUF4259 domain-containing protein [Pseudomonadota bacterium]